MTVRTKSGLLTQITTLLADNDTGAISEADVRSVFTDINDSLAFLTDIPDGASVVATLEALTGDGRLNADALRLIADAIDSELGDTSWRTGGGGDLDEDRVQELIDATSLSALQGMVTDGQIPDDIMRDAEFTAAAVRGLLSLTADEVTELLVGNPLSGRVLTFTQNDGTTATITVPEAAGESMPDGVVSAAAFNDDNTELTLTIDGAADVVLDIPAALRAGNLFISPNADGTLPDAADNQGKFVVSGNFPLRVHRPRRPRQRG